MADRLLKGRLENRLRMERAAGFSWADISRHLFVDAGVEVTAETLRRWAQLLGITDDEKVA